MSHTCRVLTLFLTYSILHLVHFFVCHFPSSSTSEFSPTEINSARSTARDHLCPICRNTSLYIQQRARGLCVPGPMLPLLPQFFVNAGPYDFACVVIITEWSSHGPPGGCGGARAALMWPHNVELLRAATCAAMRSASRLWPCASPSFSAGCCCFITWTCTLSGTFNEGMEPSCHS